MIQPNQYTPIMTVSRQRQFASDMRSLLDDQPQMDLVSFANTIDLAIHSAKNCSIALLDMTTYSANEINELACALRMQKPTIKLIAIYAEDIPSLILSHIQAGIMGFFFWGEPKARLVQLIQGASAGQAYISPEIVAKIIRRLGELREHQRICGHQSQDIAYRNLHTLSDREREVFHLVGQGMSNREIATELIIEYGTVKNHVHKILKKLGVGNRKEIADFQMFVGGQTPDAQSVPLH